MLNLKNNVYSNLLKNKTLLSLNNKRINYLLINQKAKLLYRNKNRMITPIIKTFCQKNTKNESDDNEQETKRYNYEYEAPENLDFEYKSKIRKAIRFLISLGLFTFGFYVFFLRKLNLITKQYQFYFLNEFFELKVANFFSKRIQKIFSHLIYKHESENALYALDVYKSLLEKNQILNNNLISKENIYVIESDALGCFMLKNGDLFITSRLINVCINNPNHLAFFIACEIAFQAMGLNSSRIIKILFEILNGENSMIRNRDIVKQDLPKFSLADKKKKELDYYNRFLLFYPESVILNYLEEKEVLKIALRILHKANFNIYEAIEIMKFFDEKMMFYPQKYKDTNRNLRFRYYDILQNLVKVYQINH